MKIPLLLFLIILVSVPTVFASVTNEVNIQSSGGLSKTNVEINQTGDGTSKATINGKEWKLEGPGNISVSEESTPQPSSSPSASPSATAIPSATPQELDETQKNVITQIIKTLQQLIVRLQNLF